MKYTQDWTTENFPIRRHFLQDYAGRDDIRLLEIGSYEGRSAAWFCENILTGNNSTIVCVDPWNALGNDYNKDHNLSNVRKRFDDNIRKFIDSGKLTAIDNFSINVLSSMILSGDKFDVIYIDGDHRMLGVLQDAVMCWELLNEGGVIIFDDYMGGSKTDPNHTKPARAIEAFIVSVEPSVEVLYVQYQVIIRKCLSTNEQK